MTVEFYATIAFIVHLFPKFIGSTTYNISKDIVGLDQTRFFNVMIKDTKGTATASINIWFTRAYSGVSVFPENYGRYQNDIFKAIDTLDMALFLRSLETCNINEADKKSGDTPLHAACAQSANEYFAINLANDPRVVGTIKNVDGNTPLHILAKQFNNPNFEAILEGLIRKGVNVNEKNNLGETAIHRAVLNKTIRNILIKILLKHGANVNAVTKDKMTALHYAVQVEKVDAVMCLIGNGINWTSENSRGESAMDMAIEQDNVVIAQAIQDTSSLVGYLKGMGLQEYTEVFIEKRMFKYNLKGIRKYMLGELGITDPEVVEKCMTEFPKITDPDRSNVYLALSDTSAEKGDCGHEIKENEVQLISQIGEGSFATVYQGIYDNKDVAVKVITVPAGPKGKDIFTKKVEEARKEYEITCAVSSPNILKIYGWVDKIGPTSAPGIVMELCENKSLYDYLNSDAKISWDNAIRMFKEITIGLNAIHTHVPQIIHRDLKSLNILVTEDVHLKLSDFGLARFFAIDYNKTFKKATGTFRYMAPEVLGPTPVMSTRSDIFALGIIFWEITYRTINKKYQAPYDEYKIRVERDVINIIRDENKRPTIPVITPPQIVKIYRIYNTTFFLNIIVIYLFIFLIHSGT